MLAAQLRQALVAVFGTEPFQDGAAHLAGRLTQRQKAVVRVIAGDRRRYAAKDCAVLTDFMHCQRRQRCIVSRLELGRPWSPGQGDLRLAPVATEIISLAPVASR